MNLLAGTKTWAEMIKFSHSIFALPFALLGAFLAGRHQPGGRPSAGQLALIIICMVAGRSLAMTFNRIADARLDALNPRTARRHIPAGAISVRRAWGFALVCAVVFVAACAGFWAFYGNPWPAILALPVMVYLCGYSYSKHFTRWSHFFLGSAIALSPAAAWLAIDPASLGLPTMILVVAVTCWIGGFDIIYACQDIEFDRREGLHSLPARLGPAKALWFARSAHLVTIATLVLLGIETHLGMLYFCGVAAVALLLIVENSIVHPDDFSRVNLAFFTINGIVSVLLGIAAISDVLLDLKPLIH